jgi:hypothetical protein
VPLALGIVPMTTVFCRGLKPNSKNLARKHLSYSMRPTESTLKQLPTPTPTSFSQRTPA